MLGCAPYGERMAIEESLDVVDSIRKDPFKLKKKTRLEAPQAGRAGAYGGGRWRGWRKAQSEGGLIWFTCGAPPLVQACA